MPTRSSADNLSFSRFWYLPFLAAFLFFGTHYLRLTRFPIGDDPAIHISYVNDLGFRQILDLIYPLPLLLFKVLHLAIPGQDPLLFTLLITTFLFLGSAALFWFLKKSFNPAIALVGTAFFLSSHWLGFSLNMGVLAEVSGWSSLLLAFYCITQRKLSLSLLFTTTLALSHPLGFLVFALVVLFYGLTSLRFKADRQFIYSLFAWYFLIALLVLIVKPGTVQELLAFSGDRTAGWGERSLWEIFTEGSKRRLVIPLLALAGVITQLKEWEKPAVRLSYILLTVSGLLSLNHLLGIHFNTFRFYSYFEIGLVIFAALGLYNLLQKVKISPAYFPLLLLLATLFFSIPNYLVRQNILNHQITDPQAQAILFPADRDALAWLEASGGERNTIMSDRRHAIWIRALTSHHFILVSEVPYTAELIDPENPPRAHSIFYGVGQTPPPIMYQWYQEVYAKDGAKILKAN